MATKIQVGEFTRKHGTPISYDIETQEGATRFISRLVLDGCNVEQYIKQIDALPPYVQTRHWVQHTRKELAREVALRAACAK